MSTRVVIALTAATIIRKDISIVLSRWQKKVQEARGGPGQGYTDHVPPKRTLEGLRQEVIHL